MNRLLSRLDLLGHKMAAQSHKLRHCLRVPVFVEHIERNVEHELLALLSLHWPVNCVASSTILICVPWESWHGPHCSSQCLAEVFFQKNTRLPILLVPKPTYQNPGERRKTKGKKEKGVLWLWKIERVELLLIFFHWRGHQLTVNMSQRSIECHSSIKSI